MCRRNRLRGCVVLGVGLGLVVGYLLESWLLCCCGGIGCILTGIGMMQGR